MLPIKLLPLAVAAALSVSVFAEQPGQANAADKDKAAQSQSQAGEARVVTRDGPSISLGTGAQPIIAVAFPEEQGQAQGQPQAQPKQPAAQAQGQGEQGIEVSIFVANPNESAKPKEILFESRNAANGMVVYSGNELGGAQLASAQQPPAQPGQPAQANAKEKQTQLIFSARRNGKPAQVSELAGQGNARILVVKRGDEAQAKPGQPAQPGQPQPAAQKDKAQAEANDAVIFVYLRGENAK